jgi:hypothetical protein
LRIATVNTRRIRKRGTKRSFPEGVKARERKYIMEDFVGYPYLFLHFHLFKQKYPGPEFATERESGGSYNAALNFRK